MSRHDVRPPPVTGTTFARARIWMAMAAEAARKGTCSRARCGSVIVAGDGRVIGSGFNSPPAGSAGRCARTDLGPRFHSDRTCCQHAEVRAILAATAMSPDQVPGARLYFTRIDGAGRILRSGDPCCTVCSRMALDVGIATFSLWHQEGIVEYPTDTYDDLSYSHGWHVRTHSPARIHIAGDGTRARAVADALTTVGHRVSEVSGHRAWARPVGMEAVRERIPWADVAVVLDEVPGGDSILEAGMAMAFGVPMVVSGEAAAYRFAGFPDTVCIAGDGSIPAAVEACLRID